MQRVRATFGSLALWIAITVSAAAAALAETAPATPWQGPEHVRVRVIAADGGVPSSGQVRLGLQFQLAPGWKIYWRTPGDAGIPPIFDWTRSMNIERAEVQWPAPKRFTIFGFETFGYKDEVVLPIHVAAVSPGEPLAVRLTMQFAACSNICLPLEAAFAIDLAAQSATARPGEQAELIDSYQQRVPRVGDRGSIKISGVTAVGEGQFKQLIVEASTEMGFLAPDVLLEMTGRYHFSRPKTRLSDNGRRVAFEVAVDTGRLAPALVGQPVVITVVDGPMSIEHRAVVAKGF